MLDAKRVLFVRPAVLWDLEVPGVAIDTRNRLNVETEVSLFRIGIFGRAAEDAAMMGDPMKFCQRLSRLVVFRHARSRYSRQHLQTFDAKKVDSHKDTGHCSRFPLESMWKENDRRRKQNRLTRIKPHQCPHIVSGDTRISPFSWVEPMYAPKQIHRHPQRE
jgi:hypothetical protein